MMTHASTRVPRATYRIQLRRGTTLDTIVESGWLASLQLLGVTHVYLSPLQVAVKGSTHGYDVVDHSRVDPAIGGDEAFKRFAEAARSHDLGIVVDIVPHHAAADPVGNHEWWDVLRNGSSSRWAERFDIDWDAHEPRLASRLLLPVLGDHCGREIEAGRFSVRIRGDGEPVIHHPQAEVPIELASMLPALRSVPELRDLMAPIERLPPFASRSDGEVALRQIEETHLREALHDRLSDPDLARRVRDVLADYVSDPDRLDDLLEHQPYRLAVWRAGLEDLAYRRFFDLSNLVALRVDRPDVFAATHQIVADWAEQGLIDGVRVDHLDGLPDPTGYLERLRDVVGDRWLVVEKIVERGESLPSWPIDGTTGYEVAALVDRLDVDDSGRAALQHLAEAAGAPVDAEAAETAAMAQAVVELLDSDLNRLVDLALGLCERRRRVRDATRLEVRDVLLALLSHMRRYRTYLRAREEPRPEELTVIDDVVARTYQDRPQLDGDVVSFIRSLLRGEAGDGEAERQFQARFQQLSGPARAKGCEDTAWFRLVTLISRGEVGSNPDDWQLSLADFHESMVDRQARWPSAMTSITTHDSKRSADVRARIDALSQWSAEVSTIVQRWWDRAGLGPMPAIDLYAIQTVLGTPGWDRDRLDRHLTKAMREVKVVTSWLEPDERAETAILERVHALLDDSGIAADLRRLERSIDSTARTAILSHTLLALTLPGVPDLYQGSETWHFRLTDPDNREPVDPSALARALAELGDPATPIPVGPTDGLAKLALVRAALDLRARRPESFGRQGAYAPMFAAGPLADHLVAFRRGPDAIVVVPRLTRVLEGGWRGTVLDLPAGTWTDRCAGAEWSGRVDLDPMLATWPVAILERTP